MMQYLRPVGWTSGHFSYAQIVAMLLELVLNDFNRGTYKDTVWRRPLGLTRTENVRSAYSDR